MTTDPFRVAAEHIFASVMAIDATYRDSVGNEIAVRVIPDQERKKVFDAYESRYITLGKTLSMLLPDSFDIKTGEKITAGTIEYTISNVLDNDGYVASLEVK